MKSLTSWLENFLQAIYQACQAHVALLKWEHQFTPSRAGLRALIFTPPPTSSRTNSDLCLQLFSQPQRWPRSTLIPNPLLYSAFPFHTVFQDNPRKTYMAFFVERSGQNQVKGVDSDIQCISSHPLVKTRLAFSNKNPKCIVDQRKQDSTFFHW